MPVSQGNGSGPKKRLLEGSSSTPPHLYGQGCQTTKHYFPYTLAAVLIAFESMAILVTPADEVRERAVPNTPLMQSTIPTMPVPSSEQKVAMLQQQGQALQAQVAALRSVLKVGSTGAVTILSNGTISIQSAKSIVIGGGQNVSIKANGDALVEGKGTLELKGYFIKVNGGGTPLATVGSGTIPGN